ncbi:MAG: S16 family serine protease [Planctomycetota bacterium]
MSGAGLAPRVDRLQLARVLLHLGALREAEEEVGGLLEESPDLQALSLLAKIKHVSGRLSEAVACWARLESRSPFQGDARLHLLSLLEFARDPERNAGAFLAVGGNQLLRKPVAYLELEEVLRLLVARRPAEAIAHAGWVARKYRERDREVYKLAVLARAWVAELSGDLEGACQALEELGRERGFETDRDRVLALLELSERVGSPERLEAARNILLFLERTHGREHGAAEVYGRLALLHRRLGRAVQAERYEERHYEAFRREHHRPTPEEVVQVAATRYLPLERLVGLTEEVLLAPTTLREQAIEAAVQGDLARARLALEQGGEVLDLKYLADLAVLEGERERAVELYVDASRRDPEDLRVLGRLLDLEEAAPTPAIEAFFREAEVAARTHRLLQHAVQTHLPSERLWRRLATFTACLDTGHPEGLREQSAAWRDLSQREADPIGRVLAAAVYHFVGRARGLIHQVWADRRPRRGGRGGALTSVLGNLTDDMRAAVQNTFLAVREYARARFPAETRDILDYDYSYKVTKDDEPSHGTSAGLPTALVFLSVFLQRSVPHDVAWTGPISAEAHNVMTVIRAGEVDHKVAAAYERDLRLIVVPEDNLADLAHSPRVPRRVQQELVRTARDLDQAVAIAFGLDQERALPRAAPVTPSG